MHRTTSERERWAPMKCENPYIRELLNEVVSVGVHGRLFDLLQSDTLLAVADVLLDGQSKEYRFLAHQTYVRPQPLNVQISDVVPIQQNLQNPESCCQCRFI